MCHRQIGGLLKRTLDRRKHRVCALPNYPTQWHKAVIEPRSAVCSPRGEHAAEPAGRSLQRVQTHHFASYTGTYGNGATPGAGFGTPLWASSRTSFRPAACNFPRGSSSEPTPVGKAPRCALPAVVPISTEPRRPRRTLVCSSSRYGILL